MKQLSSFLKAFVIAFSLLFLALNTFAQLGNTLYGTGAGSSITTADSIVAIGVNAAGGLTTGSRHILIGNHAGYNLNLQPNSLLGIPNKFSSNTNSNIFMGYYSGYHTTSGHSNTFIGGQSGYRNTSGHNNVFVGSITGTNNTTGYENIFIGSKAGATNTSGQQNVFIGALSGFHNTTGSYNLFIGTRSGYHNTIGRYNTFVGRGAGYDNITGKKNTSLGYWALYNNSTGSNNTALGVSAGENIDTASDNTFIGAYAGWENDRGAGAGAIRNTYLGAYAGYNNRKGIDNTGLGAYADYVNPYITYDNTVFIGTYASVNASGITIIGKSSSASGENGIAIGHQSSVTAANSIAIGYQTSATSANEIVLGNATHTTIGGSVNWTATSDGRFKTDVQENVIGLDFINKLRPVTYFFDSEKVIQHTGEEIPNDLLCAIEAKDTLRYTGFIAQEVDAAAQQADFDFSGIDKPNNENDTDYFGLRYAEFVVPLVKATQELSQKVEALEKENQAQQDLLTKYEAALENALLQIEALKNEKNEVVNQ